ncbi:MAG: azurin [Pseudomonadota bacterium]
MTKHRVLIAFLFTIASLGLAQNAAAACTLDISAADMLVFDKTSLEVERSCGEVTVNFKHTGQLAKTVMGHNWVLVASADDIQPVAMDGMAAGIDNSYVKPGDPRVLAASDVIGAGESTSVTFSLDTLTASEYTYFCSFPGHWAMMKGTLTIK